MNWAVWKWADKNINVRPLSSSSALFSQVPGATNMCTCNYIFHKWVFQRWRGIFPKRNISQKIISILLQKLAVSRAPTLPPNITLSASRQPLESKIQTGEAKYKLWPKGCTTRRHQVNPTLWESHRPAICRPKFKTWPRLLESRCAAKTALPPTARP